MKEERAKVFGTPLSINQVYIYILIQLSQVFNDYIFFYGLDCFENLQTFKAYDICKHATC